MKDGIWLFLGLPMHSFCKEAIVLVLIINIYYLPGLPVLGFSDDRKLFYREKVRSMFYHAYNGYLDHAYPLDELRPLTCSGMNTWGSFSLTLIDALDTLIIMGNYTEFGRAAELVLENVNLDANVNVSVFETNIRVVGGLLSAHMLSGRVLGYPLHPGWPCAGPLLDLAERFAAKLLPAFNTKTGMPYGTVNLRHGVHRHETPITCTACISSYILEFGTLSRLTGNPHYERVALKALTSLWNTRSSTGLVGNHINVQTGVWTAVDAGIGAGVDSYFEYLAKGGLLFQRPLLLHQFYEYEKAINQHIRKEDWFMWVTMTKAQVTLPIFQSLEAFWPSVLALLGKVDDAARILMTYNQVVRQYGVPPEFYNLPNREAVSGRSGYPLRPEFVESILYVYQATRDQTYLQMAASVVETIEKTAKTSCGYATIRDVTDFTLEDRMESFFLSETTKYLFLIFDERNFMNNDGRTARIIETTDGSCAIEGGYIFNTEAHPLDPGIIYCCGEKRKNDTEMFRRFEENIDLLSLLDFHDAFDSSVNDAIAETDLDPETMELHTIFEGLKDAAELSEGEERLLNSQDYDSAQSNAVAGQSNADDLHEESEAKGVEADKSATRRNWNTDSESDVKGIGEETRKTSVTQSKEELEISLKEELNLLIERLNIEFEGLLTTAKKQKKRSMNGGDSIASLKDAFQRIRNRRLMPTIEVLCDDCCVPLDRIQRESLALRKMLNAIYGKHIYKKAGIRFVQGPICRPSEAVNMQKRRNVKSADVSSRYMNTLPSLDSLEPELQKLDAVKEYSFSTFAFRRLANERYNLLTSPQRPFASHLVGLGQVIPVR